MSNEAPVVGGLDDVTFAENAANATPQLLFPNATYSDDAADAEGVTITVSGLLSEDMVMLSGIALGNWSANGGMGSSFVITFTAGATNAEVQDVLRALAYANSSNTPTATRDLTVTVTDADGLNNGAVEGWVVQTGGDNPLSSITPPGFQHNFAPTLFDVDRDGRLDLIYNAADGFTRVHLQLSDGSFDSGTAGNPPSGVNPGNYGNPDIVDIDGDGDLDLVYSALGAPLRAYRNPDPGFGTWHEVLDGSNPFAGMNVGSAFWSASVLDLDGDGDLDMVAGFQDGTLHYFRNDSGAPAEQTGANNPFDGIDVGDFANQDFGDVDGDGDLDLVVGRQDGKLSYFENVAGVFTERTGVDNPFAAIDVGDFASPAFGDVDGDGDVDLVIGASTGGFTFVEKVSSTGGITVTVGVTAEYEPSVAIDDGPGAYGSETTPTVGNVFWNNYNGMDYNPAGDPMSIIAINGQPFTFGVPIDLPGGGKLTMAADGWWSFDADGDFQHLVNNQTQGVSFTYTLNGGSTATVSLAFYGVDNNDVWVGGSSDDSMFMGAGDDIFKGGDGNDVVQGEAGNDSLRGEGGDDQLNGGDNNDTLVGGDGADYLAGGTGNDILHGQAGVDTFDGWTGDDTFYIEAGDIIREYDFGGVDTAISSTSFTLLDGNDQWVENLTLSGSAANNGTGNSLNNLIIGNSGANVLSGNGGADTLRGGAGIDTLYGGTGNDSLFGDAGDDTLNGEDEDDVLDGGVGNDILTGGAGYDILYGGAGNDALHASGNVAFDQLRGGLGNDAYYVDNNAHQTIEAAGEGIDTVYATGGYIFLAANIENLVMLGATDHSRGNELANQITGNTGDDTIEAMAGDDTVWTGLGGDYVWGGTGRDKLYGEAGADILDGEADNDELYGGDGNDTLGGGDGADKLWGGSGNDGATGGEGNDALYGEDGNDVLSGWTGNDTVYGGADNDYLQGEDGADKLYGETGDDQLFGGAGADTIEGGAGTDTLEGGEGVDRLTGGSGADLFRFNADAVRLSGDGLAAQRDTITDFNWAEGDRIDLSGIDAIAGGADDAFTLVTRFTKQAGQAVLFYNATADTTALRLDVDGDGKIDLEIVINGNHTSGVPILTGGEPSSQGGWIL